MHPVATAGADGEPRVSLHEPASENGTAGELGGVSVRLCPGKIDTISTVSAPFSMSFCSLPSREATLLSGLVFFLVAARSGELGGLLRDAGLFVREPHSACPAALRKVNNSSRLRVVGGIAGKIYAKTRLLERKTFFVPKKHSTQCRTMEQHTVPQAQNKLTRSMRPPCLPYKVRFSLVQGPPQRTSQSTRGTETGQRENRKPIAPSHVQGEFISRR